MVALADDLTGGDISQEDTIQDTIVFYPWISDDDFSKPVYGSGISMKAVVVEKDYNRRMPSGEEIRQRAEITIPRPIAANGAANRKEPVDPRDKIVLPNGYTGPILNVDGVSDSSTHAPYLFTIILG